MFKAGIKKELMMFTRGFRMWGILILVLGLAASYPALYKMLDSMSGLMEEMATVEAGASADMMEGLTGSISAIYGADLGYVGFITGVSATVGIGLLVMMIILMAAAGGEQKKRSVIIPDCAGLTPQGYVLPKFAIYPLLSAVVMFLGTVIAGAVANLLFEGTPVPISDILFNAACSAGYGLFLISAFFMAGISTGRPGISVIAVYLGSELINSMLNGFRVNRFNPYALYYMIGTTYKEADMNNFVLSLIVTVTLSVICCLITLMVVSLRKIDNSVGEANL